MRVGALYAVLRLETGAFNSALNSSQGRFSKFLGVIKAGGLIAAQALAVVGAGSLAMAASFEASMQQSLAIMGDVTDDMRAKMEAAARAVAKTSTFSANEAADAYYFLASAGYTAEQSIAALPTVTRFAQAGVMDLEAATSLLMDAQTTMGLRVGDATQNMENMARVSDVLAAAQIGSNATLQEMAEALTNKAGPALRLLNKDIEEGAAVLMVMANSGLKGRAAGTALGIVLRELQTKAIANKKEFAEMGVAVYDAEGNMRNIADIIGDLEGALEGLTDEQKKEAMLSMGFTDRSVGFIQQLLGQSDAIAQYEEELRKAGGTTEEVAEKQLDTFNAQLEIMWHKIQDVAITIGQALLPRAKDAVKAFGDWVDENHELISSIAIGLFDAIGKVMGVIGTFIGVIGTVIEKLQPVVRWVGDLIFVLKHLDAYAGKDGFFGQLATLILPIVEGFEDLVGWIGQTAGEMDIIGTVMPIVGEIFRFFSEEILPTFVALWTALVEDVLPRLVDAFTVIAETVGPALGDLFSWIAEEMLPKLGMAFEWLREDVLPPVISLFEFIVSWFISNWPTISSIAKQVFGAVGEAIEFVAGVVGHVVPVIWGLLQPIAAVLFPLLGAAASVLLSAIDIAFKAIGLVFEVFGNVATGIYHAVTTVWSAMGDFFGGIWDNIDETFRGGINVLIGLINGFFGFLNNIHIDIPSVTIPGIDATIGGGSIDPFNIGLIPELWRGTRGWGGGLALVGEQGPELVAMPQGSNVYSNRELGGMGGPSEVHYHKHFSPDIDIDVPEREPLTKDDVVNILRDLSRLEAV